MNGTEMLVILLRGVNHRFWSHLRCSISFRVAIIKICGRYSGKVVSKPDSGSRGAGLSPGRVIVLCSWARHFTLTVPLSTQEYKWVPANYQGNLTESWGVTCDGLASHPRRVAILLVTSCYGNQNKLQQ